MVLVAIVAIMVCVSLIVLLGGALVEYSHALFLLMGAFGSALLGYLMERFGFFIGLGVFIGMNLFVTILFHKHMIETHTVAAYWITSVVIFFLMASGLH